MVFMGLSIVGKVLVTVVTVPDGVLDNLVVVLCVPGLISPGFSNTIVTVMLGNSHCVDSAEYTKEFWLGLADRWAAFAVHSATCAAASSLGLVVRDAFVTPTV